MSSEIVLNVFVFTKGVYWGKAAPESLCLPEFDASLHYSKLST